MAKLTGKVAVVSGASKGIGAAIAEELAAEGASVVVNYSSSKAQADEVVARIQAAGGSAKAVHADLSKRGEAKELIDAAVTEFGGLDILVNNAGRLRFRATRQDRRQALRPHLRTERERAAVRHPGGGQRFRRQRRLGDQYQLRGGAIGHAYGVGVQRDQGSGGLIHQNTGGGTGSQEVRVNSVLPGPVETEGAQAMPEFAQLRDVFVPQTPLGRIGQPKDIATVVSFLASEQAGWITGQVIPVAGGLR